MTQLKEGNYLPLLLGLGLIGSNFFSLVLLSKSGDSLPNLASLATTENSSSQMRYKKDEQGLEVVINHNMHSPKTVLFSSEKSKWNGKTDYTRKEYVAHQPGENAALAASYLQCIKKSET